MIKRLYCEYYDNEQGCVISETRIYFLGLLVYYYTTSSTSLNAIYSYVQQEESPSGLYDGTNMGFKQNNTNETEEI